MLRVMTRLVLAATCLVALIVCSSVTFAQSTTAPAGHWEGAIQAPGQELKIEIDLAGAGDKWEGTITIPAQNLKALPLSVITVQGDTVSLAMQVPGNPQFKGVVKDGKTLSGDFSQGGGTAPFTLTRTGEAKIEPVPKSTPITKELEGTWAGSLDANGKILQLVLRLSNQPGGAATGTLVSLDQGGAEIPIVAVVQTGTHLKLVVKSVGGIYEGDVKDDQLKGTWWQGGGTLPLVFKRRK
jgi:hypothetical protein